MKFDISPAITLYHGDFREALKLAPASIDLFFFDAPFNYQGGGYVGSTVKERYLHMIDSAVMLASYLLKPGGNLIYINNPTNWYKTSRLFLERDFIFRSQVPLIRRFGFRVKNHLGFRHNLLVFLAKEHLNSWQGGSAPKEILDDVWDDIEYTNMLREAGHFHPQAITQELTDRIIELTTLPGDKVFDPCIGSGTTALSCMKLKRKIIGYDINIDYIKMTIERIKEKQSK